MLPPRVQLDSRFEDWLVLQTFVDQARLQRSLWVLRIPPKHAGYLISK